MFNCLLSTDRNFHVIFYMKLTGTLTDLPILNHLYFPRINITLILLLFNVLLTSLVNVSLIIILLIIESELMNFKLYSR